MPSAGRSSRPRERRQFAEGDRREVGQRVVLVDGPVAVEPPGARQACCGRFRPRRARGPSGPGTGAGRKVERAQQRRERLLVRGRGLHARRLGRGRRRDRVQPCVAENALRQAPRLSTGGPDERDDVIRPVERREPVLQTFRDGSPAVVDVVRAQRAPGSQAFLVDQRQQVDPRLPAAVHRLAGADAPGGVREVVALDDGRDRPVVVLDPR